MRGTNTTTRAAAAATCGPAQPPARSCAVLLHCAAMGALSMLLRDPAALPYLVQVKVRLWLGVQLEHRAARPASVLDAATVIPARSAGIARRRSFPRTSRSRSAMARACCGLLTAGRRAHACSRVCGTDVLNRVSRSFAIVIQQLGPELRDAVCFAGSLLRRRV